MGGHVFMVQGTVSADNIQCMMRLLVYLGVNGYPVRLLGIRNIITHLYCYGHQIRLQKNKRPRFPELFKGQFP